MGVTVYYIYDSLFIAHKDFCASVFSMPCMKPFSASPGCGVFIKVSPIRKPRNRRRAGGRWFRGAKYRFPKQVAADVGGYRKSLGRWERYVHRKCYRHRERLERRKCYGRRYRLPELSGYAERVLHIGDECAEVTIVNAYHVHILTYISKFAGAVDFEQHFQSQGVRPGGEVGAFFLRQTGGDEQYGVRTCDTCLQQLVFVDDEVFSQVGMSTSGRAVRMSRNEPPKNFASVRMEMAEAPAASYAAGISSALAVSYIQPFRGRAPLELGNDSRGEEAAHVSCCGVGRGVFH